MHLIAQVHSSLLPYSAFTGSHAGVMRRNTEAVAFYQRLHISILWGEGFRSFALLGSMLNR